MSKKLGTLEAGALNAWTPVQQAALYQQYLTEQHEKDNAAKLKAYQEEEKKKSDKEKGIEVDVAPEQVSAGKIVDDMMKKWCEPLYDFSDIFAAPHVSIVPFILLHLLFWWTAPWYFQFLLPYPLLYGIPIYMTLRSIWSKKDRPAWYAFRTSIVPINLSAAFSFMTLITKASVIVLFRENARSLIWWPKIKAALFFVSYCTVDTEEGERDRKTGKKPKLPIYLHVQSDADRKGSMVLIKRWLPKLPEDGKTEDKDKEVEKVKKKEEEISKDKEKENAKAQAEAKAKAKAKGNAKD